MPSTLPRFTIQRRVGGDAQRLLMASRTLAVIFRAALMNERLYCTTEQIAAAVSACEVVEGVGEKLQRPLPVTGACR